MFIQCLELSIAAGGVRPLTHVEGEQDIGVQAESAFGKPVGVLPTLLIAIKFEGGEAKEAALDAPVPMHVCTPEPEGRSPCQLLLLGHTFGVLQEGIGIPQERN